MASLYLYQSATHLLFHLSSKYMRSLASRMYNFIRGWIILTSLISASEAVTESYNGQYADDCPELCSNAGASPSNWTHIHTIKELQSCNKTILFDVNLQALVDDHETVITIRGCSASESDNPGINARENTAIDNVKANEQTVASCSGKETSISIQPQVGGQVSHLGTGATARPDDIQSATRQLSDFFQQNSGCGTSVLFAKSNSAVIGMYSGAQVTKNSTLAFLHLFQDQGSQRATQLAPNL